MINNVVGQASTPAAGLQTRFPVSAPAFKLSAPPPESSREHA